MQTESSPKLKASDMDSASSSRPVLVVGSVNVDLYKKLNRGLLTLSGTSVDITSIKGQTLPARSFVQNPNIAAELTRKGIACAAGQEEKLLLQIEPPFEQRTGGKGANAAAAAGQTSACEFIGNFGRASDAENTQIFADLTTFGRVCTRRCELLDGPTGTAYILTFEDNDNCILLLGGANQTWPAQAALEEGPEGQQLREAIQEASVVMLQREVPDYVNLAAAKLARLFGRPVFMDVGGTDAPLDPSLMPFLSVVAPNESELAFISGVSTQVDGRLTKTLVRKAVAALKAKFEDCGNSSAEVLVTLGSQGAMHFGSAWRNTGSEASDTGLLPHESRAPVFELETADGRPTDTCGAGDCFRGSYAAFHYSEGRSVEEALRWASAAGSLAVEVEGAMPSMPTRSAIESRLAKGRTRSPDASFDA